MKIPLIDLNAQYLEIKEEINSAIVGVLESSTFVGGDKVSEFEQEFANYIGTKFCIGCGNGSDALELALQSMDIGSGDEVIVPAFTWIATASAVVNIGAIPVFVDVLSDEFTIDPTLIESKITSKTKAIIPVHLFGLPARMPEIMKIAEKHGLLVVEDCAQAHGAAIQKKKVGTFGNVASFSFYPVKNLGAYGDAGVVMTDDEDIANRVRMIGNYGQFEKHDHRIHGRNSRLDSLQAAILSVKLKYLERWIESKQRIANQYRAALPKQSRQKIPPGYRHVFHIYAVLSENRNRVRSILNENGIGCEIHYPKPVPCVPAFGMAVSDYPIADFISSCELSLPIYAELKVEDVDLIIKNLLACISFNTN